MGSEPDRFALLPGRAFVRYLDPQTEKRSMTPPTATIFGGSGFIGRYIVERLAKRGWILRIAVRRPDQALFLQPLGDVAQIVPIGANIRHERSVAAAVRGVDTVINLVGILYEGGRQRFAAVHVAGVRRVARAA